MLQGQAGMKHWGNNSFLPIITFSGCCQLATSRRFKCFSISLGDLMTKRNDILFKRCSNPTAQKHVNKHQPCGTVSTEQCQLSKLRAHLTPSSTELLRIKDRWKKSSYFLLSHHLFGLGVTCLKKFTGQKKKRRSVLKSVHAGELDRNRAQDKIINMARGLRQTINTHSLQRRYCRKLTLKDYDTISSWESHVLHFMMWHRRFRDGKWKSMKAAMDLIKNQKTTEMMP